MAFEDAVGSDQRGVLRLEGQVGGLLLHEPQLDVLPLSLGGLPPALGDPQLPLCLREVPKEPPPGLLGGQEPSPKVVSLHVHPLGAVVEAVDSGLHAALAP